MPDQQRRADLGRTAFGVATARAAETARADRLFRDPLADRLLDAAGPQARSFWTEGPGAQLSAAMGDYVALRTRYFDDCLAAAAAAGCRQVVVLAAGLDARAFRLDWPAGLRMFELDQPEVLDFKDSVLAGSGIRASCDRVTVGADLRAGWETALRHAGFRPELATAWLVEGLLVYLTAAEADRVLTTVGALSAAGSRLAVEFVTTPMLDGARQAGGTDAGTAAGLLASLWRNDSTADPVDWLAGHGWRAQRSDLGGLAGAHGRPVPPVFDPARPGTARVDLLSAIRS